MNQKILSVALFATAMALTSAGVRAQAAGDHAAHHADAPSTAATQAWTEGEVRKIDAEQGKITFKHGPIANLGMPGMTMVFKAADPKLLSNLKEGDKVRFAADKVNGVLTVTAIEPAHN
jgi:Cu/Ag efflux protein CusF